MKHKKIPTIVLIILAVPVTVGLMIGFVAWRISVMANSQIEDINGDSKELAVITDEDIEAHEYGCVTYMSGWSTTGSKASGVQGDYEEYDKLYKRILLESICVRYTLIRLYEDKFNESEAKQMKSQFKADCATVEIREFSQYSSIEELWK